MRTAVPIAVSFDVDPAHVKIVLVWLQSAGVWPRFSSS